MLLAATLAAAATPALPVPCLAATLTGAATAPGAVSDHQGGAPDARVAALMQTLQATRVPLTASISPDGNYVAWTTTNRLDYELHLTGIAPEGTAQDGAWDRILSPDTLTDVTNLRPGRCGARSPAWSPDGRQLAFLSDCHLGPNGWSQRAQPQLFVWRLQDNAIQQVTDVTGAIEAPAWSPDGRSVGFLLTEHRTGAANAQAPVERWSGVIGEDSSALQRVAITVLANPKARLVTPPGLHVYEFDWSPDSQSIAYIAADPPGDSNWWTARLYRQQVAAAREASQASPADQPTLLLDPTLSSAGSLRGLQLATPRWSPGGDSIALIGGLMSDQGVTGGDLYLVLAGGGAPRNLAPGRRSSVVQVWWQSPGTVGIAELTGGAYHLSALDAATGAELPAGSTRQTLAASIQGDDRSLAVSVAARQPQHVAFIRSTFAEPPEVWAGEIGGMHELSHLNDGLPPVASHFESVQWQSEGHTVQGWLLYPAGWSPQDAAAAKRYPLVVSVHGGPASAAVPHWPSLGQNAIPLAALGYFVLLPNPRGSFGQGEAFTQANRRDFGHGDLRDILAGVDSIVASQPVDPGRIGLTGWSYGGFLTMFAVTQTHRFRAAVAGAGISDWKSYAGENSIDGWMIPYFGATVYDDPEIYARSSAIDAIKQATTPTLVLVGERDGECPAPQSFEFWHGLRAVGVKSQLVVYPDEGHSFTVPSHRQDALQRTVDWFATQMP
ncbi:MAG: alpha/beta fold hydrolase [Acidobacteriota bacterium]|nr:alpha/beta fold hydrolase [Acidobacteriota bacterium]